MAIRYTAAVVGGGMGGRLSLAALHASARFDLVAAADLRADVRAELEQLYPGLRTFDSHHAMFDTVPTDVICVSTYPPSHLDVTCDALGLPLKGLLVEKPLGDTYAAGRTIVQAIQARQLPAVVPHNLLVLPHVQAIIERVRGGEIGQIELIEIECNQWDIINAGIHWLNFAITLLDEPFESVIAAGDASTRTYRDGMQVETVAVTYAQTRSGVRVIMQTGDDIRILRGDKQFLFRLIGTAGLIEFYAWEHAYHLRNAAHPAGVDLTANRDPRSGHQIYLDTLAAQIDSGTPDYRMLESSLAALELCEAAYRSIAERCLVRLPLEQFVAPFVADWQPGQQYHGVGGGRDGRKLPQHKP